MRPPVTSRSAKKSWLPDLQQSCGLCRRPQGTRPTARQARRVYRRERQEGTASGPSDSGAGPSRPVKADDGGRTRDLRLGKTCRARAPVCVGGELSALRRGIGCLRLRWSAVGFGGVRCPNVAPLPGTGRPYSRGPTLRGLDRSWNPSRRVTTRPRNVHTSKKRRSIGVPLSLPTPCWGQPRPRCRPPRSLLLLRRRVASNPPAIPGKLLDALRADVITACI